MSVNEHNLLQALEVIADAIDNNTKAVQALTPRQALPPLGDPSGTIPRLFKELKDKDDEVKRLRAEVKRLLNDREDAANELHKQDAELGRLRAENAELNEIVRMYRGQPDAVELQRFREWKLLVDALVSEAETHGGHLQSNAAAVRDFKVTR